MVLVSQKYVYYKYYVLEVKRETQCAKRQRERFYLNGAAFAIAFPRAKHGGASVLKMLFEPHLF